MIRQICKRRLSQICQKTSKSNLANRRLSRKWPSMIGLDFVSFTFGKIQSRRRSNTGPNMLSCRRFHLPSICSSKTYLGLSHCSCLRAKTFIIQELAQKENSFVEFFLLKIKNLWLNKFSEKVKKCTTKVRMWIIKVNKCTKKRKKYLYLWTW